MTALILGCKTNGTFGKGIRYVERFKYRKAFVNHIAVMFEDVAGTRIYQAEPHGVTSDKTLDYLKAHGTVYVTPLPGACDPVRVEAFLKAQVGSDYAFLSDFSVALDILLPPWAPSFRGGGTWECAAVAAESCRFGGWLYNWPDIYGIVPVDFWTVIGGSPNPVAL